MKIELTAAQVGVLLQFAAKHDIRAYLKGICVQVEGRKGFAIASDGVILGVFRLHLPEPLEETEVIIPRDILENAKCTATAANIVITADPVAASNGTRAISVQQGAAEWRGTSSPGPFLYWKRVIPENISGEAANLSGIVQEKLIKAAKIIQGSKNPLVGLGQNGESASMIDLGHPDFFGVAMPIDLKRATGKGEPIINAPTQRPKWIC